MVLNKDGWILTAGHIVENFMRLAKEKEQYDNYQQELQAITADQSLTRAQRKNAMRGLKKPLGENLVTHVSAWWGQDGVTVATLTGNSLTDIAVGQMRGFDTSAIQVYPEFKNPDVSFDVGEGLCKLGFPFHDIQPTFDEAQNMFRFPPGAIPIPFFPMEGIFTRIAIMESEDGKSSAQFVETSSPGLRGQSGGPTFDTRGRIWAMQSRTQHYALGFSPSIPNQAGKEHQFLNTGLGVHARELLAFLRQSGVSVRISGD